MDEKIPNQNLHSVPKVDDGEYLTTNQGVRISDNQHSLKAGVRGPTLLEDFILREKITSFDHERIPERVVHARGAAAHGYFQVYEPLAELTSARFLQDPSIKTPVFVRFSTVAGSRGSADTARDARGFATRFYTEDGNFDLVGNNIPIFFIQDAHKFPDLVHAFKPEPHNEIPQASTAHDNFWDFISLVPESMHMIMWVMSDHGIPRSLRMMDGFGVNTFRFVNVTGKARFVKFHWKSLLGFHSLVWDEAKKIAGADADFHRRDLWDAIELGEYPEYEFGVQLIDEADQLKFGFDVLDPTKIWPEELVPLRRVGKMTLNRNPDNFFAETEQAAFHPGHVVPGIDFSNDPLLQGRLFSYLDTQLTRLGGPNFAQIPINQSHADVNNNQQDGYMRFRNRSGRVNYEPNTLGGGCPMQAPENLRGYVSYPEKIDAPKVRERSSSFEDFYSQAAMFWHSQADWEQAHLVQALQFELAKVASRDVRQRMVDQLALVDGQLAARVASAIGIAAPKSTTKPSTGKVQRAPETSLVNSVLGSIKTRRIAILAAPGVDGNQVQQMKAALTRGGAHPEVIASNLGTVKTSDGSEVVVDKTLLTTGSILYDAVYVPGGAKSVETLRQDGDAIHYVAEAYKHGKAIAATGEGADFVTAVLGLGAGSTAAGPQATPAGVVLDAKGSGVASVALKFVEAIGQHRFPTRGPIDQIPA